MPNYLEDTSEPTPAQWQATAPGFINPAQPSVERLKSLAAGAGALARTLAGQEQQLRANKIAERNFARQLQNDADTKAYREQTHAETIKQRSIQNKLAARNAAIADAKENRNVKTAKDEEERRALELRRGAEATEQFGSFNALDVAQYRDDPAELQRVAREIRNSLTQFHPDLSTKDSAKLNARIEALPIMREAEAQRLTAVQNEAAVRSQHASNAKAAKPMQQKAILEVAKVRSANRSINAKLAEIKANSSEKPTDDMSERVYSNGMNIYVRVADAERMAKLSDDIMKEKSTRDTSERYLQDLYQDPNFEKYIPSAVPSYFDEKKIQMQEHAQKLAAKEEQRAQMEQMDAVEEQRRAAEEQAGDRAWSRAWDWVLNPDGTIHGAPVGSEGEGVNIPPEEYNKMVQDYPELKGIDRLAFEQGQQ